MAILLDTNLKGVTSQWLIKFQEILGLMLIPLFSPMDCLILESNLTACFRIWLILLLVFNLVFKMLLQVHLLKGYVGIGSGVGTHQLSYICHGSQYHFYLTTDICICHSLIILDFCFQFSFLFF